MYKKILLGILGLGLIIGSHLYTVSASTIQGFQGGTGIATSTSSTLGQFLKVASTTPFLTYTLGAAGGGSVSTSSAISTNNFPYWVTVGGGLSGTSSLSISGTTVNNSGTITVNGVSVLTSASASATISVAGVTFTTPFTFSTSTGIGITSSSGAINFSNTGVTSVTGTLNQVTVSGNTGAVTFSIPNPLIQNVSSAALTFTNATGSGVLTANTVSSTGITFNNATTTGVLTASTVSSTGLTFSNATSSGVLTASSVSSTNLTFSNATSSGNLQVATLKATGAINASSTLTVTAATVLQAALTQSGGLVSIASTTITGTVTSTNLAVTAVTNALGLFGSGGALSAYGGASACAGGQAVTTISAQGTTTCAAFGAGTLTGNGTVTYIPYYETATGFLSNANFTYSSSSALFSAQSSTISGLLKVTGAPAAVTTIGQTNFGNTPLSLPNASGTYISGNTAAGYNGDWIALQQNSSTVLRVASSGATTIGNTTTTFQFLTNGHLISSSTSGIPALSSCGTSPTSTGSDQWGRVVVGGTATACTITFVNSWVKLPACVIGNESLSVINAMTYVVSTSSIVISQTGLSNDVLHYICGGNE